MHCGGFDFFLLPGTQRTAGSSENNAFRRIALGCLQALEDGGMFAVHRQHFLIQPAGLFHYQFAAGDQGFFIGQQHLLAYVQRGPYGVEAGNAGDGTERGVRLYGFQRFYGAIRAEEPLAELQIVRNFIHRLHHSGNFRAEFTYEFE